MNIFRKYAVNNVFVFLMKKEPLKSIIVTIKGYICIEMKKANLKQVFFNIVLNKRNSFFQHIYMSNTLILHMK